MEQLYRVPFERNSERVKGHDYVEVSNVHFSIVHCTQNLFTCTFKVGLYWTAQCLFWESFVVDADAIPHEFILIDETGFNLTKVRWRERNIIGHRAILNVPGQRGGNITMCAAITQNGVLHLHPYLSPYNTVHILTFLDRLHSSTMYLSTALAHWFHQHPQFLLQYSPFLNSIEDHSNPFHRAFWKLYKNILSYMKIKHVKVHFLYILYQEMYFNQTIILNNQIIIWSFMCLDKNICRF